jgi:hypothetical protein
MRLLESGNVGSRSEWLIDAREEKITVSTGEACILSVLYGGLLFIA